MQKLPSDDPGCINICTQFGPMLRLTVSIAFGSGPSLLPELSARTTNTTASLVTPLRTIGRAIEKHCDML